jgi:serine/threonine protein kinase
VADALIDLHRLPIYHVDLNPMNILHRVEHGRPIVRIIDFESSYDPARHGQGEFYDPPTTAGFTAPEVSEHAPDARSDVYSLGAVLYTLLAGFEWTWRGDAMDGVTGDRELDPELREMLLLAVNRDPDRRPGSARAFHAALVAHVERVWPGRAW